jgi:hypothetical protein
MRNLRRLAWSAAVALAAASPAAAQFPTDGGGGIPVVPGGGGAFPVGTGGTGTGGGGTQGAGGIGPGGGGGGGIELPQGNFELAQIKDAPSRTTTNNAAISTSNFLRNTYGSVYYQGSDRSLVPNRTPGGFGTAIFPPGVGGGAAGGRGGAQVGGGGFTQGGRAGAGAGGVLTADPGGQLVALPRQIAYASQIQFKTPAGNPVPQLQFDLRTAIDRVPTNMLTSPARVQVDVDGRNVTLRGTVRDDEEARLVEGLVRLTPGVFGIRNELTFPK